MPSLLERFASFIREDTPHQVVTVNLQFLSEARKNRVFAQVINSADVVVADGMPLVWMSRLLGVPVPQRITGHDLLSQCAALAAEKGHAIFLLGGAPGVAEEAADRLRQAYPGLRVRGTGHGHFPSRGAAEQQAELVSDIREFRPQFLFVALGCPKQDYWVHDYLQELGVPVCLGVGGTLDVYVGRLKRSPVWMQRFGLEWIYRLQQEPRRLWRRYMLEDLPSHIKGYLQQSGFRLCDIVVVLFLGMSYTLYEKAGHRLQVLHPS